MTIVKWRDPLSEHFRGFRDLDKLQNEVNRMYESFFGKSPFSARSGVFPAINVYEDHDNIYVTAELPGVQAEEIEITVEADSLIVKGERRLGIEGENVSFHRREREAGAFNRKISLPTRISTDKVNAETKDGVLKIIMPKAEEVKPRKVEIKAQ